MEDLAVCVVANGLFRIDTDVFEMLFKDSPFDSHFLRFTQLVRVTFTLVAFEHHVKFRRLISVVFETIESRSRHSKLLRVRSIAKNDILSLVLLNIDVFGDLKNCAYFRWSTFRHLLLNEGSTNLFHDFVFFCVASWLSPNVVDLVSDGRFHGDGFPVI